MTGHCVHVSFQSASLGQRGRVTTYFPLGQTKQLLESLLCCPSVLLPLPSVFITQPDGQPGIIRSWSPSVSPLVCVNGSARCRVLSMIQHRRVYLTAIIFIFFICECSWERMKGLVYFAWTRLMSVFLSSSLCVCVCLQPCTRRRRWNNRSQPVVCKKQTIQWKTQGLYNKYEAISMVVLMRAFGVR